MPVSGIINACIVSSLVLVWSHIVLQNRTCRCRRASRTRDIYSGARNSPAATRSTLCGRYYPRSCCCLAPIERAGLT